MGRDASGTYTLPLANVTTATTITSTWANTSFADFVTEFTDSLSRSGKGGLSASIPSDVGCTGTFNPEGDVTAGDNAAVGYAAANGLILTGQGSTNDVTILNDAKATVARVPTGTVGITFAGTLTVPAATTSIASVNMAHGTAPSSPTDGDIWTTSAGVYVRVSSGTVGPLVDSGGVTGFTEDSDLNFFGGTGAGAALVGTSALQNLLAGSNAGSDITTGDDNVVLGAEAGTSITTGSRNIAICVDAMGNASAAVTGSDNIAIGQSALGGASMAAASENIAIGQIVLDAITTGDNNTSVGSQSGSSVSSNSNNSFFGYRAGFQVSGGTNTIVGANAGDNITTGTGNVIIGYNTGPAGNVSDELWIGNSTDTTPLLHGDFSTDILTFNGTIDVVGGNVGFPATAVPSADANTLDDYQEGTFTPKVQDTSFSDGEGQTYGTQLGRYTKIGDTVHFVVDITMTSIGTLSGNIFIVDLPFTSANDGIDTPCVVDATGLAITAGHSIVGVINANGTILAPDVWDATTGPTAMQASELSNDGTLRISGTYFI